jgi:hypothetical protein
MACYTRRADANRQVAPTRPGRQDSLRQDSLRQESLRQESLRLDAVELHSSASWLDASTPASRHFVKDLGRSCTKIYKNLLACGANQLLSNGEIVHFRIAAWSFSRGTECGASWTAAALYLRRRRSFLLGAAQRRRGGRRGGNAPAPAIFAQLLGGRGPLGLPEGPNGPKNGSLWALGSWGQRDLVKDELIERRPEEQGTQDARKKKRGDAYIRLWQLKPPPA